jgi:hypothetical protein
MPLLPGCAMPRVGVMRYELAIGGIRRSATDWCRDYVAMLERIIDDREMSVFTPVGS